MRLLRLPLRVFRLLMQSVSLALGQVWSNKARSMLTTIGIIIGVASVTAVIAALTGLQTSVLNEFESLGTNKMFIEPSQPDEGRFKNASGRVIRFYPEQFDGMLDHCPSVEHFTRISRYNASVHAGDRSVEQAPVVGVEASWHEIENRTVTLGRPLSVLDNEQSRQVCLIGTDLRDTLRLDRDCIGEPIYLGGRLFHIVGVIEPRVESSMFGGQRNASDIYIPFATAWNLREPWLTVVATSESTGLSDEARAEIRFFLRRVRGLRPDDPDTFQVHVVEQFVEQFNQVAMTITMVAGGIVGISLLVGGVGIMNIMLVSVSERTREIGLRKAVGALPSAIMLQFLVEAVVLCFFGGIVGVLLGQLFTRAIASIPDAQLENAHIPPWAIALAFGFSALVGLVFGFFPAVKAARLDPIEALRHE